MSEHLTAKAPSASSHGISRRRFLSVATATAAAGRWATSLCTARAQGSPAKVLGY